MSDGLLAEKLYVNRQHLDFCSDLLVPGNLALALSNRAQIHEAILLSFVFFFFYWVTLPLDVVRQVTIAS